MPEMQMSPPTPAPEPRRTTIDRREAIRRVSMLLGGVALVGGNALLTGCRDEDRMAAEGEPIGPFTDAEIALLDEIADTILPETSTPGAKAAAVGPFMALMVMDTYYPPEQHAFRDGLRQVDVECQETHGVTFMEATPAQRLTLLERLDREQMAAMEARSARASDDSRVVADSAEADAYLPDQRQQSAGGGDAASAVAITADAPPHYFRMMKELALLGYFTSEIGYNQAMRYEETPGRFDPCVPYTEGEKTWAPHA